jgi:hypothetical protein
LAGEDDDPAIGHRSSVSSTAPSVPSTAPSVPSGGIPTTVSSVPSDGIAEFTAVRSTIGVADPEVRHIGIPAFVPCVVAAAVAVTARDVSPAVVAAVAIRGSVPPSPTLGCSTIQLSCGAAPLAGASLGWPTGRIICRFLAGAATEALGIEAQEFGAAVARAFIGEGADIHRWIGHGRNTNRPYLAVAV